MRIVKLAVATNLALSATAVFLCTGHGLWYSQKMVEQWMGLSRGISVLPMWVDVLFFQSIVLVAFFMRHRTDEWRVRLVVAGIGAIGLLFSLGLPLFLPDLPNLFPPPTWTADRTIWWYACISDLAYGLVGTTTPEVKLRREADRFAELSKRLP